jgi:hypothetical protein
MTEVFLRAPRAEGATIRYEWESAPRTSLYLEERIALELPADFAARDLPEALLWRTMLLLLHSQWPLLRPCRVHLPIRLPPGEARAWERLMASEIATLEALAGMPPSGDGVEIVEEGTALADAPSDGSRFAAAFSGGKDSLLQAAILSEVAPGSRPLLVATTSPMPGLHDHQTERRRRVLEEVPRRLPVEVVEIVSGFRANLDHGFAQRLGYPISVNEMTDTFLYTAALVVAGRLRGAGRFFLASENELQENSDLAGRTVQYSHFMYSVATQTALARLLGVSFGSLTSPLHSYQVQELLLSRYPGVADLQYSCWRVGPGESACSRCSQCLRIAVTSLASGGSPRLAGIDPLVLFPAMRDWEPRRPVPVDSPSERVSRRLHAALVESVQRAGLAIPLRDIFAGARGAVFSPRAWKAAAAYVALWRALRALPVPPAPGLRSGYLEFVDATVRGPVEKIYRGAFRAEEAGLYRGALERTRALASWILAPLEADAA